MNGLNGHFEIRRTSQYVSMARAVHIFVDGEKVDSIKNGQTRVIDVAPGKHIISAQIDWCKTDELAVDLGPNETAKFVVGSDIIGWKILFSIYFFLDPKSMIYLRKAEDNKSQPT